MAKLIFTVGEFAADVKGSGVRAKETLWRFPEPESLGVWTSGFYVNKHIMGFHRHNALKTMFTDSRIEKVQYVLNKETLSSVKS